MTIKAKKTGRNIKGKKSNDVKLDIIAIEAMKASDNVSQKTLEEIRSFNYKVETLLKTFLHNMSSTCNVKIQSTIDDRKKKRLRREGHNEADATLMALKSSPTISLTVKLESLMKLKSSDITAEMCRALIGLKYTDGMLDRPEFK